MKTVHQLLRQPVKTLFLLLLVFLASAMLVICVGQYTAAGLARANLDDRYDTVALLSDEYFGEDVPNGRDYFTHLPEDIQSWVDNTLDTRRDLVKEESHTQVYSAYIPGVAPDNFSQYENGGYLDAYDIEAIGAGYPYRCAMLEVTLTAVGTEMMEKTKSYGTSEEDMQSFRTSVSMLCAGRIERVLGLEQGFASPVGSTIALLIRCYDEEDLAAMELEPGARYLVYGTDYSDTKGMSFDHVVSNHQPLFDELFGEDLEQVDCRMTVCNEIDFPVICQEGDDFVLREDLRNEYIFTNTDNELQLRLIPTEEAMEKYAVPTMVKLSGTGEAFLEEGEGQLWKETLEHMEISNHAFPVLAVDKLGYQVAFARGDSRITEGRDFTQEELTKGGRVCIISENLAVGNGLSVGDTIPMQTYGYDPNIAVVQYELIWGTRFPSAAIYSDEMGFTSQMEEYTIVGIYRQNNAWENQDDFYGLTPNVVFVPKGSISGDFRWGDHGILYTLVLHNGKMTEFQELQTQAGYPELFICMDGGYTEIASGLDTYEGVAAKALYIGAGGGAVILLLFLVLCPLQQRKNLFLMGSLGTSPGGKIRHIFVSTMALMVPGVVLGVLTGALLWKQVATVLMGTMHVQIPMEANMAVLAPCLAAGLVAAMAVLVLTLAAAMSGSKGMMNRKG